MLSKRFLLKPNSSAPKHSFYPHYNYSEILFHPLIYSDFLTSFYLLAKESRILQCLSARRLKGDICWEEGKILRCLAVSERPELCCGKGFVLNYPKIMWKAKIKIAFVVRNMNRNESSYKSIGDQCENRGDSGTFSLQLEGTQLSDFRFLCLHNMS